MMGGSSFAHDHLAPPQVLTRAAAYHTHVDVCIVTDEPDKVENLLRFWDHPRASVCGAWHEVNTTADPFALVWEHRAAVEKAVDDGEVVFISVDCTGPPMCVSALSDL